MKDTRKHKYLIGYVGEGQVVYSDELKMSNKIGSIQESIEPMTLSKAKKEIRKFGQKGAKKAIYELVPIIKLKD